MYYTTHFLEYHHTLTSELLCLPFQSENVFSPFDIALTTRGLTQSGLGGLDLFSQFGHGGEQVGHESVIGDLEYGCIGVLRTMYPDEHEK